MFAGYKNKIDIDFKSFITNFGREKKIEKE